MKNITYIVIVLVIVACKKDHQISFDQSSFNIQSEKTNAEFIIKTAMPKGMIPSENTRILYLLDAEWYFDDLLKLIKKTEDPVNGGFILIGIEKGRGRTTDYTPSQTSQGEGGANEFFEFIESELIPTLNNRFDLDIQRNNNSILGHSLGGLAVTYAFTNYNHLFKNYLALSPSNWYDEGLILALEEKNRVTNNTNVGTFFLTIAELEITQIFNRQLFNEIKNEYPGYLIEKHTIKKMDHSSSAKQALEKAIRFFIKNT